MTSSLRPVPHRPPVFFKSSFRAPSDGRRRNASTSGTRKYRSTVARAERNQCLAVSSAPVAFLLRLICCAKWKEAASGEALVRLKRIQRTPVISPTGGAVAHRRRRSWSQSRHGSTSDPSTPMAGTAIKSRNGAFHVMKCSCNPANNREMPEGTSPAAGEVAQPGTTSGSQSASSSPCRWPCRSATPPSPHNRPSKAPFDAWSDS